MVFNRYNFYKFKKFVKFFLKIKAMFLQVSCKKHNFFISLKKFLKKFKIFIIVLQTYYEKLWFFWTAHIKKPDIRRKSVIFWFLLAQRGGQTIMRQTPYNFSRH